MPFNGEVLGGFFGEGLEAEGIQQLFGGGGIVFWLDAADIGNVADEGFGCSETLEQGVSGSIVVSFRKAFLLVVHEERHVRVLGRGNAKQLLQVDLLWRG